LLGQNHGKWLCITNIEEKCKSQITQKQTYQESIVKEQAKEIMPVKPSAVITKESQDTKNQMKRVCMSHINERVIATMTKKLYTMLKTTHTKERGEDQA
jgi:hypothetical protein